MKEQQRSQWASKLGFVLAAAGSAVGLGNIWKFPGKVAAYGGGAFILCYLAIVALIGLPVMLAELSIGRATQKNVVGAFRQLDRRWSFAGGIGVVTLFVIMSYYSVVGGWVLKYVWVYLTGADFGAGPDRYSAFFSGFISQPLQPLVWAAAFLALCIYVVVRGVSGGIERVSKVLMPCLFLLLIAVALRAVTLPGAGEGLRFLFSVQPGSLTGDTLVGALGQAFFSLSVGMGIMITYGSYVPKNDDLFKSAASICALDTLVALLSAAAIVPVVFVTLGQEGLGMGGGFAFMALPEVFAKMPGGRLFGLFFFVLLFLAALTSAISILESCTAFLIEEFHLSRLKATGLLALPLMLLGAGYSLSQAGGRGINLPWFDFSAGFQWLPMNAVMEKFTDNLMIPLGALCFCLFVGWVWGTKNAAREIGPQGGKPFPLARPWGVAVRFAAPLVILVILYFTLGKGQGLS
ncbi:sodium-dependent transporter [Allofournierella sp.]|uniref:sodium-dependent transporter n=1 Tax=Allofournierella sp. TaxID=1940256 RepID=UPI003AB50702